jgi:hypothetical protein
MLTWKRHPFAWERYHFLESGGPKTDIYFQVFPHFENLDRLQYFLILHRYIIPDLSKKIALQGFSNILFVTL